ncbi:hypothetical protein MPSEU_000667000 [Mayamaea pseudoterrestris]|nr:hypothetical protein MPSEU_000667000 [Mayamaea pseudoterrestris]
MRRSLATFAARSKLNYLDVRKASLSVLERLLLEEILLKSDATNSHWMIVGHHSSGPHKYLTNDDDNQPGTSDSCIVMGIRGKPELLLNLDRVRRDRIKTIKRFSGGGTVVVDANCIWTSIIGRKGSNDEAMQTYVSNQIESIEAFPRPIMEWTANAVFGPLFEQLNRQQQRQDSSPTFQLLEHDYVLSKSKGDENKNFKMEHRKMGGNAQAIVREGWLHHTSFLWTFNETNMRYLTLPSKRPDYRADRKHSDFLVQLQSVYPHLTKNCFCECLREVCDERFDVTEFSWDEALTIVEKAGGMPFIYEKSRTRVLKDL